MFAFLIWDAAGTGHVRRARLVRHQAALHLQRRARALLRQREEGAAGRRRARSATATSVDRDGAAALPDPAVRARAGVDAHARSGGSSRARASPCAPASSCEPRRYFRPDFAIRPAPEPEKLYREITEALEDSVAKHMRADVTVGSFLSGGIDSTVVAALAKRHNPKLLTFTTGFEREGYSEIDVAAESAAAIGVEHITKVVTAEEMMDDAAADRLVPRRSGGRPGARAAVLHRPRGPQARQGRAVRRGRRRAVRRLHDLPRADLAAAVRPPARPSCKRGLGALSARLPEGLRGKDLLRRGAIGIEERYYGNARIFRPEELTGRAAARPTTRASSYMDVTRGLYAATDAPRRLDPDAVRRPVHLAARRHPGQGRQDDDGELARAAGAVPRHRGVRRRARRSRPPSSSTKETTKYALRRAIADIVPAHVLNRAKLGFPVPIRHWLKDVMYDWARADHHRVAGRPVHRSRPRRWRLLDGAPQRPARLLAQDLDAAGLHDLARHLRRGAASRPQVPEPVYPVRL